MTDTPPVDYEAWCKDLCGLLDAIELAVGDDDRVQKLLGGRFDIALQHGITMQFGDTTSGERH